MKPLSSKVDWKMKGYKKAGLALCTGILAAALGAGAFVLAGAEDATDAADAAVYTVGDAFNAGTSGFENADVYKYAGVYNSGDATHALIPSAGWGDPVALSDEAYLLYRFQATDGMGFDALTLYMSARIFGQNNDTAYAETNITVYAGETESALAQVVRYGCADGSGGDFKDFTLSLDEVADGKTELYVKIELNASKALGETSSLAMMPIRVAEVSFEYTEKEAGTQPEAERKTLADNFISTTLANSGVYKSSGACGGGSSHGVVPSSAWGDPVTVAEDSWIMYKLESTGTFDSLLLDINAKIWNQNDGTAHNYNSIEVWAGTDENALSQIVRFGQQGSSFVDLAQADLSGVAAGEGVVYVKIQMNQCLETTYGNSIPLDWLGVKLGAVSFTYTESEAEVPEQPEEPDENAYEKGTDFTAIKSLADAGAVDYAGLAADANPDHGAIPSEVWGDPYKIADESYVTYRLDATELGEGKIFKALSLDIDARIWGQNDATAYAQNSVIVYVGYREDMVNQLVKTFTAADSGGTTNRESLPTLDLTPWAAGYETVYVKIRLVQSTEANCGKNLDDEGHDHCASDNPCGTVATADGYIGIWQAGVKLYSVDFTGETETGEAKVPADYQLIDEFTSEALSESDVYTYKGVVGTGNATHGLISSDSWGGAVKIAEESYIIYRLTSDTGYAFSSLSVDISAWLWNQSNDTAHAENAVNVYAGIRANDFGAAIATFRCTDATDNRLSANVDLSSVAAGRKIVYVKIELVQSAAGCSVHTGASAAASSEHIGTCGSIATADGYIELNRLGVKLYGVSFQGVYQEAAASVTVRYNDGDTTLWTDTEQEVGMTLNGYNPPAKAGYTFEDWYLDADFAEVLPADYVAEGDITLYAKYVLNNYRIKYNLNGGTNAASNPDSYTVEDTVVLADPVREGYVFGGWYTNSDFEGAPVSVIEGSGMISVELYAMWTPEGSDPSDSSDSSGSSGSSDSVLPDSSSDTGASDASSAGGGTAAGCGSALGAGALALAGVFAAAVIAFKRKKQ